MTVSTVSSRPSPLSVSTARSEPRAQGSSAPAAVAPAPVPRIAAERFEDRFTASAPAAGGASRPAQAARTPQQAVREANSLLLGPTNGKTGTPQNSVLITNPVDVNAAEDRSPTSARHKEAGRQVKANAGLERQALARLSPAARQQYQAVQGTLRRSGDAVAELSLQKLLLEGRLGARALRGGDTTLSALARLNTQPLAPGLDRAQLLGDVTQELACPASINQGWRGTCAATSVLPELIRQSPAEYARLLSGLASPEGRVTLASGHALVRERDVNVRQLAGRAITQQLFGPAAMELANGALDYRDGADKHFDARGKPIHAGLNFMQVDTLRDNLFGRDDDSFSLFNNPALKQQAWDTLKRHLAAGQQVQAGMKWGEDSGHKVSVFSVGRGQNGQEYILYNNPWGQQERMAKDEFLNRLWEMNFQRLGQARAA